MMMMMSRTGVLKTLQSLKKANIEKEKPSIEIAFMMMMSQTGVLKTLQSLKKAFAFAKPLISLCLDFA